MEKFKIVVTFLVEGVPTEKETKQPRMSHSGYNLDDPFGPDGVFGPCEKADKAYADAWAGWYP